MSTDAKEKYADNEKGSGKSLFESRKGTHTGDTGCEVASETEDLVWNEISTKVGQDQHALWADQYSFRNWYHILTMKPVKNTFLLLTDRESNGGKPRNYVP